MMQVGGGGTMGAADAAISRRKAETATSAVLTAVKVPLIWDAVLNRNQNLKLKLKEDAKYNYK